VGYRPDSAGISECYPEIEHFNPQLSTDATFYVVDNG